MRLSLNFVRRTAPVAVVAVVALCAWSMAAAPALAAGTDISIEPGSLVVAPGEQRSVDVVLHSDVPLRGAQLSLRYDPNVIQIDSVVEGGFFRDWAKAHGAQAALVFPFIPDNATGVSKVGGIALFGGQALDGASGAGTLLTIQLTGLAGPDGATARLEMDNVILASADARPHRVDGVEAAGAAITIGPPDTAAPPPPAPTLLSAPPPPAPEPSVVERVLAWWQINRAVVGILGSGLVAAAAIYVAVMRFGPRRRSLQS